MDKPFGIVRFKPDVRPAALKYKTREQRDAAAQRFADRDEHSVGTEDYQRTEGVGWEWRLTGSVEPTPTGEEEDDLTGRTLYEDPENDPGWS